MDDNTYLTATPETVGGTWVFDHPHFIILNLAIGGDWPGPPDATTPFPLRMYVDYVRVYQVQTPPPPSLIPVWVEQIDVSVLSRGPNWEAVAAVTVADAQGPRPGVKVLGSWSGLTDVGVTERVTDAGGIAVLNSGKVRTHGTMRFTVSDLLADGCFYQPPAEGDWAEIAN